MKRIIAKIGMNVITVLRGSIKQILLIHVMYTAFGFILFAPMIGGLGKLMLYFSDKPVLADTDILYFLLTPFGLAALILLAAVLITIIIFEQTSMMANYIAASNAKQATLIKILGYTAKIALKVFIFSLHLVIRILTIILPFLALAAIVAWLTITDYDINYYLSTTPPIFIFAAIVIGLILVIMLYILIIKLLSWSLTLPLILFTDTPPAQSFSDSKILVKNNKKLVFMLLGCWALASLLLTVLLLGIVDIMTNNLVPLFYNSMAVLVLVIGALVVLLSLGNFFITALASGTFVGILIELFSHFGQSIDMEHFADKTSHQPRLSGVKLAILLICGVVVSTLVGNTLLHEIQATDDLVIVAHRGAAGKAPENTMAAITQALEDKTDWVELDVQETVDGHVIVIHDSDFMKLASVNLKVWDATLEQIKEIDVGSWFAPEFSAERPPTLKEALEAAQGHAKVVIELKYYGHDQQLEQRVIDIVEELQMVEDTAIMSLKYDSIQKVRMLRPGWTVGLLSAQVLGDMRGLDADFLAVNMAMATSAFIRSNQAAGKKVFVWTVNDKMSMFRMMSLGVDGIITDEPELARQVIAERSELNSVERLLVNTAVLLGKDLTKKTYRDQSP